MKDSQPRLKTARAIRNGGILLLACLGLACSACASLPRLPVPKNEADTLLVIVTGQHMDVQGAYLYTWELQLDSMDKPIVIRPWEKYALVSGLAPGDHMSMTLVMVPYSSDPAWSMKNAKKPTPQSFPVPFTMKAGTCTVFPVKFIYQMKVDAGNGTGQISFLPQFLNSDDLAKEAEAMKILKNFSLWKTE